MRNPVTSPPKSRKPLIAKRRGPPVRTRLMFPERVGQFASADRQFGRSVLLGLALVGMLGMIGPVVAYRADVAALRTQFRGRVAREALVHAEALGLHFELLRAELDRLALRPEVNLQDNTIEPEQMILDFTHRKSALFGAGVVLLDSAGKHVWSEPKDLLADQKELALRGWFQKAIALGSGVVEALDARSPVVAVAVPIIRNGQNTGVLVGLVDPRSKELPGARPIGGDLQLLVADRAGNVFLPREPRFSAGRRLAATFDALLAMGEGDALEVDQHEYFAVAKPIGTTGLRLMLLADEEAVSAPIRHRFLFQLLFIAVLQLVTLLLFSLYFRRTYQSFLRMETRAAEQEKMAALGSAASLIAHEVKNSLNGLKAAASVLTTGADPALPARTILGQIDRLGHLASSLLYFGKPPTPQLVRAELDAVVKQAVEALRLLPEAEEVQLEVSLRSTATLDCDPLLLVTALDNLIRNAIEASVAAKDLGRVAAPQVRVRTENTPKGPMIAIEDNAGGLPQEFDNGIFEPFVTSKPKGIGLGLSMARRALEQQGASLSFERTEAGTCFYVRWSA